MTTLPFKAFDADNHYYEAEDAFTRYIDPKMAKRCMQWATINGKKRLLVGEKVNRYIPNPTFDPVSKPGALQDFFRGENQTGGDLKSMFGELEPLRKEYRDRDARLKLLDAQGLEATLLFPTLAVGMQSALRHDIPAICAAYTAFNRWLEEDWGFAYKDRIYGAPIITLTDPEWAVRETRRLLDRGARILSMVPGPVPLANGGSQSPALPVYDEFWGLVNDAGITVGIHGGDAGLHGMLELWEPGSDAQAFSRSTFDYVTQHERAIFDTMAAIMCHGLFERHPNVRLACIETGGMFAPKLIHELKFAFARMPYKFATDPVALFKANVWVSPFYEDDIRLIAQAMGVDHCLFGSDFPHAEGLPNPIDFATDLESFSQEDIYKIMYSNVKSLISLRPSAMRSAA